MKEIATQDQKAQGSASLSRRKFLNYAGAVAGAGILIASCKKDEEKPAPSADVLDLGSNDLGLMNYAYLLQQLEAAFYIEVLKNPFSGMTDTEKGFFVAMRDHDIVHREFLKNFLGTDGIPAGLENDWSSIDFNLKSSVMAKAKLFEETAVAGLNGICRLLVSQEYINFISAMAMVDARHSAIVNDFIYPATFAEKADGRGMEVSQDPQSSLDITRKFFKKTISGLSLPRY